MSDFQKLNQRARALMVCCIAFGGAIMCRAAFVQVVGDPRLESMARRQFQSKTLVRPRRGPILDRNGEALAVNMEMRSLAANPSKIKNKRFLARMLAKSTDVPYAKLLEKLGEKREFVWIKRHLSERELDRFVKWHVMDADGDLVSGLWMIKESKRVYPHGELAAHVLGDVNLDSEGLEGTELWANELLQGKVVSVNAVKDALGRPTFIDTVAAQQMKDGEQVTLTLDASLQYAVQQELHNQVAKSNARGGSVIVMNAVNGEILAMANEPSFNPNDRGVPVARRRNRVFTDGYEPGSTMKAVLLSTALTHGMKLSDQLWGERGSFYVQGHKISEAEAKEKFEWTSLKKMMQVSSNVIAAKLALRVGADHYSTMLKNFGFGSKTNTGFPGEISGRVPPRKAWQPLSLANIGFGQGVLVTPMQMTRAYAAFLNGGWLVQPQILKTSIKGFKPEPPKRILTQKVSEGVIEALRTVTLEGGTGIKASLEGYEVAGKTGTAQLVDPNTGKYSRSAHIASFIGFAIGVEPKLVIFTSIDEPKGIYFASETAAPLFHQVLNATVNRFSIPPTKEVAPRKLASADRNKSSKHGLSDRLQFSLAKALEPETADAKNPIQWQSNNADGSLTWKMPPLQGLTPREAIRVVQGHKFQLELHGTGVVHLQYPEEGKAIADGGTIKLSLVEP